MTAPRIASSHTPLTRTMTMNATHSPSVILRTIGTQL
jgi:hypothetical protein